MRLAPVFAPAAVALAAGLAVAAGCAASVRGTRVALTLQGVGAGAAEQQRCLAAVQQAGAVVDANAPVQALVTLEKDGARLQVVTMRRGLVRDEKRAGDTVETLCRDAVAAAAAVREPVALDAPPASMPHHDTPASTATSGGAYRGPISDQ